MTAPKAASSVPPLYGADSMLFIYHFENNKDFGDAAAHLLRRTEEGHCRLVCTTLALSRRRMPSTLPEQSRRVQTR